MSQIFFQIQLMWWVHKQKNLVKHLQCLNVRRVIWLQTKKNCVLTRAPRNKKKTLHNITQKKTLCCGGVLYIQGV